ncbi:MAG: phage portal protein, partial [Clostridia bacterium]|nr:phage portal protein [Clostridia bacterium]
GLKFDTRLKEAAQLALIHGRSFMLWNVDHVHVFKITEFAPLLDEYSGKLRAGVRFWQLDGERPLNATLYEADGYTELRKEKGKKLEVVKEKTAYKQTIAKAPADAEETVVGEENYTSLPIVTLWGSKLHQSTLVGMRGSIDAFDLIRSGFADDLQECAQIYWILENYNGMNDKDLLKFRDRMKLHHIAAADTEDGGKVTAHTQDVPHEARTAFLAEIRAGMYEDFGLLDLRTLSAAATNDHIVAAYQPQDDMADDFEYQIIEAVQQLLALQGIYDTPQFKRGKVSNSKELVEMLVMEAGIVDLPDEVLLNQFPNFTPEQVEQALDAMTENGAQRVTRAEKDVPKDEPPQDGEA